MHNRIVRIPTAHGELHVLFTHAAFAQLEARGYSLHRALAALADVSVVAIEAALLAGLEGHRVRTSARPEPWTPAEVRRLLADDGALWGLEYSDLIDPLVDALMRGARRGKATPPETPAETPTS